MSSGLSDNFLLSIGLLIKLKRYFKIEDYTSIGDRLCKTASYGVQLEEVNLAFDSFNENCYYSDYLSFSEFLATLSVLGQAELRGKKAGLGLADMVNGISELGYSKSFDEFLEENIDSLADKSNKDEVLYDKSQ